MRRISAGLAVTVVVGTLAGHAGPASARPPTSPAPAGAHSVTLITGDRVVVLDGPDGTRAVTVTPGPGRAHIQYLRRAGTDRDGRNRLQVIPADAQPLLSAGRLDPRLFDVTGLIRQGYDDRSRADLPLLVSYRPGVAARSVGGLAVRRDLPSINGASVREPRAAAGAFWQTATAGGPALEGVAKIWLDGRSRLLDDRSNDQIGVPVAWRSGYTGKGVTVAVLDGGYDPGHPDLAGVVAEARDFTGSPVGTTDEYGHGTHVASTIAGSGAASAGKYRGVAPDAKLLIGRVCGAEYCDDSDILAGMEWAAGQHPKVVSMSLGSEQGTDGTDPLSTAVNNLTASSGTLFVVAAGNAGRPGTIGAPGSADAALTVGSVSRTDAVSSFSSRGPRTGDYGLKPDLAAPGEAIVAARAAGTSMGTPVDDRYTAASGTSMATPHVAGAAAILAQRHPDWTAVQLKAGLMSTATAVTGSVFDQGAGRVDVARAVSQGVRAEPAGVGFGFLTSPVTGHQPATRPVTYHNDGDAAVTLTLAPTAAGPGGTPAPAGLFTLDVDTVTVPAHGTAAVRVTEHPAALAGAAVGAYSGRLVAIGPQGTVVQTALGVTDEDERYDVTVRLIDRYGRPAGDDQPVRVYIDRLDRTSGADAPDEAEVVGGTATVRLPRGAYGLGVVMVTDDPAKPGARYASGTVAAIPGLMVDHPGISLTVDARTAKPVRAVVDAPDPATVVGDLTLQYTIRTAGGNVTSSSSLIGAADNRLYAVPVRGDAKTFAFGYHTVLTTTGHGADRTYFLAVPVLGRIPANPAFRLRDRDLHRSDARYFSQGVPAATADRVAFPHYLPGQSLSSTQIVHVPLPGNRIELHTTAGFWSEMIFQQYLPNGPVGLFEGAVERPDVTLRAGRDRTDWNKAVAGPDLSTPDFVNMVFRSGNTLRANVSSYSPSEPGHVGDPVNDLFFVKGTAVLSRDGTVLARRTNPNANAFTVPADAGRYTLALSANRQRPWSALATQVSTVWTFTSAPPAAGSEPLPLPTVKVGGDFGATGSAPAGKRFTLDIAATSQAGAAPAAVSALSVELSADDGRTWQAVPCARQRGGHWRVPVTNPAAAGGYVSLRVKATNALGNTLEQTVVRAYGLS